MGTTGNGALMVRRLRRSGGRGLVSVSALWYGRAVALFEGQQISTWHAGKIRLILKYLNSPPLIAK